MYFFIMLYEHSAAQTTETQVVESTTKVVNATSTVTRKCSQNLSKAISRLCNNEYKIVKRDTSSLMMDKLTPKDLQEHITEQRLLVTERWRRERRQIVDECCNHKCTIGHLIRYCHRDDKLARENPEIYFYFINNDKDDYDRDGGGKYDDHDKKEE